MSYIDRMQEVILVQSLNKISVVYGGYAHISGDAFLKQIILPISVIGKANLGSKGSRRTFMVKRV